METASNNREIPLPGRLKQIGESLNRVGFASTCRNIRMCYGLELVATAIKDNDMAKAKQLMEGVRHLLISDIGSNLELCTKLLDEAIETRIQTNRTTDPIYAQSNGRGRTVLETMADMTPSTHLRSTLRGRINLIGALKHLHEAMYQATLIEKSLQTSFVPVETELILAYRALKPSTKNQGSRHILRNMASLGAGQNT